MKYLKNPRVQHWAMFLASVAGGVYETYEHGSPITAGAILVALVTSLNKLGTSKNPPSP